MVQQATQVDFTPRINPRATSAEAPPSIDITAPSGLGRWTKDDRRAAVELGIVAAVGAMAGWFSGLGIFVGAAASIASFWLALIPACVLEFAAAKKELADGDR